MMGQIVWKENLKAPIFSCQFLQSSADVLATCGKGPHLTLLDTHCVFPPTEIDSLLDATELPVRIKEE